MEDQDRQNKHGETWQEAKRRYNRNYYRRNRDRLIEAQKARERALKAAEAQRRAKAAQRRLEGLRKGSMVLKRLQEEWKELGAIVAKMDLAAGMGQQQIYAVLQGLTTKRKIAEWCAKGKKLAKLKANRKLNRG